MMTRTIGTLLIALLVASAQGSPYPVGTGENFDDGELDGHWFSDDLVGAPPADPNVPYAMIVPVGDAGNLALRLEQSGSERSPVLNAGLFWGDPHCSPGHFGLTLTAPEGQVFGEVKLWWMNGTDDTEERIYSEPGIYEETIHSETALWWVAIYGDDAVVDDVWYQQVCGVYVSSEPMPWGRIKAVYR